MMLMVAPVTPPPVLTLLTAKKFTAVLSPIRVYPEIWKAACNNHKSKENVREKLA